MKIIEITEAILDHSTENRTTDTLYNDRVFHLKEMESMYDLSNFMVNSYNNTNIIDLVDEKFVLDLQNFVERLTSTIENLKHKNGELLYSNNDLYCRKTYFVITNNLIILNNLLEKMTTVKIV